MKTAIVILNYNTRDHLRTFLPKVLSSLPQEAEAARQVDVVVADNGSTDGSAQLLREEFPGVPVMPLGQNLGYTGGYNKALGQVEAEYYVLLNSDVEPCPGWLETLTRWMDSHPDCGACAPKLLDWRHPERFEYAGAAGGLVDRYGYPYCRGRIRGWLEQDKGQYDTPAEVLWASGAALMVRAKAWRELGGLDGRFFAHMEEIDLCWRMQLHGWRVWVVPPAKVYHLGGGTLPSTSVEKLRLNYRNNLWLLEKNLAPSFKSRYGWSDEKCHRAAARRLFVRRLLDGMAALCYLATGRSKAFAAVLRAHREFRANRASAHAPITHHGRVVGWTQRPVALLPRFLHPLQENSLP